VGRSRDILIEQRLLVLRGMGFTPSGTRIRIFHKDSRRLAETLNVPESSQEIRPVVRNRIRSRGRQGIQGSINTAMTRSRNHRKMIKK
jgi:hypothetical protein